MGKIRKSSQIAFDTAVSSSTEFVIDANLDMTNKQIENLADGTVSGNAVNLGQLEQKISEHSHLTYQLTSEKNVANGYSGLGPDGLLNPNQLPPLAITNTFEASSESAMLALDVQVGDVAIRTDISKSFILATSPASTLLNWKQLLFPGVGTYQYINVPKSSISGIVNGTNKSFVFTVASELKGDPIVYLNGIKLNNGDDFTYSDSSGTITVTFATAPKNTGAYTDEVGITYLNKNLI